MKTGHIHQRDSIQLHLHAGSLGTYIPCQVEADAYREYAPNLPGTVMFDISSASTLQSTGESDVALWCIATVVAQETSEPAH